MSLKDELLKANLISKKQLKKIEHEQRVEKKKLGKKGLKEKEEKRSLDIEKQLQEQKHRDKQIQEIRNKEESIKETQARVKDIIKSGVIKEGINGTRKFFFVDKEGYIPFLLISNELGDDLARGKAGIIEYGKKPNNFHIVHAKHIKKISEINKDFVRFFSTPNI